MNKERSLSEWSLPLHHALLKGVGYTNKQIEKPLIGVLNIWGEINPGAGHLDRFTERIKAGIEYISVMELGNVFLEYVNWRERYRDLLAKAGDLLTQRLGNVSSPFCLRCAEKSPAECHRSLIAEYPVSKGHEVEHIE